MRMFAVDQITCGAGEEADSSLMMESSSLVCSAADQSPAPNSTWTDVRQKLCSVQTLLELIYWTIKTAPSQWNRSRRDLNFSLTSVSSQLFCCTKKGCIQVQGRPASSEGLGSLWSVKASPSETLLTWSAVVKCDGPACAAFPGCITRCFTLTSQFLPPRPMKVTIYATWCRHFLSFFLLFRAHKESWDMWGHEGS